MKDSQVKDFFEHFLNNVYCYVRIGGVHIDKSVEYKNHLVYEDVLGLKIYSSIEHNAKNITDNIFQLTEDRTLIPYGDVLNYLRGSFINQLKKTELQVGVIFSLEVKKIDCEFRDGMLANCKITFNDGSICQLLCITKEN